MRHDKAALHVTARLQSANPRCAKLLPPAPIAAKEMVQEVLDMYSALRAKLSPEERGKLERSMGMKMEQLKAGTALVLDWHCIATSWLELGACIAVLSAGLLPGVGGKAGVQGQALPVAALQRPGVSCSAIPVPVRDCPLGSAPSLAARLHGSTCHKI